MNWFTRSRRRCLGLLAMLAFVLALTLSACGSPANASNPSAPASKQGQLNALYNDYLARLSTAEGQFDTAQSDFPALTPENFNYNRSSYEASLNSLKTAEQTIHNALTQATKDAHQIAQILKSK